MCSLHKFILSVSGVAQETRQRSLTRKRLSHCLLATLPKPEAVAGMFECLMPGLGRFRKVLLILFTVLFHTSWVCGSQEGPVDGLGLTGGTGGFDFMTSRSRRSCYTGDQVKCGNPDVCSVFTGLDATGGKGLDGGRGFSWGGKRNTPGF